MGFYGNITGLQSSTSFSFSKYAPNRFALAALADEDGVAINAFANISYNRSLGVEITSGQANSDKITNRTESESGLYYVKDGNNYTFYKVKVENDIEKYEKIDFPNSEEGIYTYDETRVHGTSRTDIYKLNYDIDLALYSDNYDSTIWTKIYGQENDQFGTSNGYLMLGDMNGVIPTVQGELEPTRVEFNAAGEVIKATTSTPKFEPQNATLYTWEYPDNFDFEMGDVIIDDDHPNDRVYLTARHSGDRKDPKHGEEDVLRFNFELNSLKKARDATADAKDATDKANEATDKAEAATEEVKELLGQAKQFVGVYENIANFDNDKIAFPMIQNETAEDGQKKVSAVPYTIVTTKYDGDGNAIYPDGESGDGLRVDIDDVEKTIKFGINVSEMLEGVNNNLAESAATIEKLSNSTIGVKDSNSLNIHNLTLEAGDGIVLKGVENGFEPEDKEGARDLLTISHDTLASKVEEDPTYNQTEYPEFIKEISVNDYGHVTGYKKGKSYGSHINTYYAVCNSLSGAKRKILSCNDPRGVQINIVPETFKNGDILNIQFTLGNSCVSDVTCSSSDNTDKPIPLVNDTVNDTSSSYLFCDQGEILSFIYDGFAGSFRLCGRSNSTANRYGLVKLAAYDSSTESNNNVVTVKSLEDTLLSLGLVENKKPQGSGENQGSSGENQGSSGGSEITTTLGLTANNIKDNTGNRWYPMGTTEEPKEEDYGAKTSTKAETFYIQDGTMLFNGTGAFDTVMGTYKISTRNIETEYLTIGQSVTATNAIITAETLEGAHTGTIAGAAINSSENKISGTDSTRLKLEYITLSNTNGTFAGAHSSGTIAGATIDGSKSEISGLNSKKLNLNYITLSNTDGTFAGAHSSGTIAGATIRGNIIDGDSTNKLTLKNTILNDATGTFNGTINSGGTFTGTFTGNHTSGKIADATINIAENEIYGSTTKPLNLNFVNLSNAGGTFCGHLGKLYKGQITRAELDYVNFGDIGNLATKRVGITLEKLYVWDGSTIKETSFSDADKTQMYLYINDLLKFAYISGRIGFKCNNIITGVPIFKFKYSETLPHGLNCTPDSIILNSTIRQGLTSSNCISTQCKITTHTSYLSGVDTSITEKTGFYLYNIFNRLSPDYSTYTYGSNTLVKNDLKIKNSSPNAELWNSTSLPISNIQFSNSMHIYIDVNGMVNLWY